MRRISAAFLVLALSAAPLAMAAGNGTKVGLLDWQSVLQQSKAGQEVQQQLQAYGTQLKAKMGPKQAKLKKEQEELQKNAKIESKAQQKQAEQSFETHYKSYQQQAHQAQQSFRQKQASLMMPLKAKLDDVVESYAKQHGFDLILDAQAAVYNAPSLDITDQVLKAFNKAQPHAPPPDTSAGKAAAISGPGGPGGR